MLVYCKQVQLAQFQLHQWHKETTIPYSVTVNNISSTGTFDISLGNLDSTGSGANSSDTLVINFAVIKVS